MLPGSAPYKDAPKGPGGDIQVPNPTQMSPSSSRVGDRLCHQATAALGEEMSPGISGTPLGHLQGVPALCRKGP